MNLRFQSWVSPIFSHLLTTDKVRKKILRILQEQCVINEPITLENI